MPGEDQLSNIVVFIPNLNRANIGLGGAGVEATEGVPADMQRFVHFMKIWNPGGTTVVSLFQNLGGVYTLKDQQMLTQYQTVQVPPTGPSFQPIQSYLGSSFIAVTLSSPAGSTTSGVGITMQIVDRPAGGI